MQANTVVGGDKKIAGSVNTIIGTSCLAVISLTSYLFVGVALAGPAGTEEEINRRIAPLAKVTLGVDKPAAQAGSRSGEQLNKSFCQTCHAQGVGGAPITGDKTAWAPRIVQGLDKLVEVAMTGKNAMPPKGGVADITPEEMARAIAFIANQAGASFTAPEPPAASN